MRILIDAGVPKDSMRLVAFHKRLRDLGHDIFVTVRKHECTVTLLDYFDIDYTIVGIYGGKTLKGKLIADLERALELVEVISQIEGLEVIIHFANPAMARVSFGLGIPQIILEDTPQSNIIHRLTLPLATYALIPKCLPKKLFEHIIPSERIVHFDSVDPIEWISTFRPDKSFLDKLGLDINRPIIVLRPAETYAYYYLSYSKGRPLTIEIELIKRILTSNPDAQIVVFPRYPEQRGILQRIFGNKITMPEKCIPAFHIIAYSTIVITGGGSIFEEGGLYGVPSVCYFPRKLNSAIYLREKGLPVFHITDPKKAIEFILQILREPDKYRVDPRPIINKMEKPSEKLILILEKIKSRRT